MRKSTFVIAVVLVVALCVPAVAFAALTPSPQRVQPEAAQVTAAQQADERPSWEGEGSGAQRSYHHPEGRQSTCDGFVDADGDGVCDRCAGADGSCPGYVDADEDGVCDNYGDGSCPGYVDADGDGVCDNYGDGCPGGRGHGCQNGTADGAHHGRGHGCGR